MDKRDFFSISFLVERVRRIGVCVHEVSCGSVRVCRCVCESVCGRGANFFFCLHSSCVCAYVTQCVLVVAVILRCSTFLIGSAEALPILCVRYIR